MSIDDSSIDAFAFYSKYSQVVGKPTNSRNDGREYHGSCPVCSGRDRFAFWESGRYSCSIRSSGCGIYGSSPYWFLRDVEGLTHVQACEELNLDRFEFKGYQERDLSALIAKIDCPSKEWQERAESVIYVAQKILWSDRGKIALDWLRDVRGLTDETIRNAKLGYVPIGPNGRWLEDTLEQWRLPVEHDDKGNEVKVWLPEGVTIPWYCEKSLWKVNIRRLQGLKEGDKKYFQIKGSGEGMYQVDAICPGTPLVIVESEIDALTGKQEVPDLAVFVASGSASRGRRDIWLERMRTASLILISYDNDDAGELGSSYWLDNLAKETRTRWIPWAHDINDMHTHSSYLRLWLETGIKTHGIEILPPAEEVEPETGIDPLVTCDLCPLEVYAFLGEAHDGIGTPYCEMHYQLLTTIEEPYQASPITSEEQFNETVQSLAGQLDWNVRLLPKGFTLKDRVQELEAMSDEEWSAYMSNVDCSRACPFSIGQRVSTPIGQGIVSFLYKSSPRVTVQFSSGYSASWPTHYIRQLESGEQWTGKYFVSRKN